MTTLSFNQYQHHITTHTTPHGLDPIFNDITALTHATDKLHTTYIGRTAKTQLSDKERAKLADQLALILQHTANLTAHIGIELESLATRSTQGADL